MRTLRAVLRDAGDSKTEVRLMMGWLAVEEENWAAADVKMSDDLLKKIDAIHCDHRNPNLQD